MAMHPRSIETLSDEDLLPLIRQGDQHAFTLLVKRHAQVAYRIAYRIVWQKEIAEELVQDAFTKLWAHPEHWKPEKQVKFTTWFYRIVVNGCIDHTRRQLPEMMDSLEPLESGDPLQDEVLAKEQSYQVVRQAVHALPERQRLAVTLCYYNEVSNQQAAEIMGVSLKALEALLVRAKQGIRLLMFTQPARKEHVS